jgi:hypothetical protein
LFLPEPRRRGTSIALGMGRGGSSKNKREFSPEGESKLWQKEKEGYHPFLPGNYLFFVSFLVLGIESRASRMLSTGSDLCPQTPWKCFLRGLFIFKF